MAVAGVSIRVTTTLDTHNLEKLLKECPHRVQMGTRQTAEDILEDVDAHWSPVSPSSPGQPPAEVTSGLSDSGRVRFVKGGLLSEYKVVFEIARAKWLENGTRRMSERPFLRPAALRAKRNMKENYKAVFKR